MNLKQFLLALHLTPGVGKAKESKVIAALNQQGNPEQGPYPCPFLTLALVLGLEPGSQPYRQIQASYEWSLDKALAYQGEWLTYFDDHYPKHLKEIYQPPLVLFYQGDLRALALPSLAVVGARAASSYGLTALRQLLPDVIKTGIGIVSGLAKGIDVMAHQTTFHYGGVPVAVIGTGLDRAISSKSPFTARTGWSAGVIAVGIPSRVLAIEKSLSRPQSNYCGPFECHVSD
ncbi:Predicted Rossmann fold nucleotide-binding protein DprA/Smf involved in DNA uptake (Smf) [Fructobacillus cardui]|nr:Predicted Rossmann fold nucleotide-binding protein DprA/Smf involved in DNA uptake (Smf) [Fructobacillus cardui]